LKNVIVRKISKTKEQNQRKITYANIVFKTKVKVSSSVNVFVKYNLKQKDQNQKEK